MLSRSSLGVIRRVSDEDHKGLLKCVLRSLGRTIKMLGNRDKGPDEKKAQVCDVCTKVVVYSYVGSDIMLMHSW